MTQPTEADIRDLITAIINAYHTTRVDADYVPHILSKALVQYAFQAYDDALARRIEAEREAVMVATLYRHPKYADEIEIGNVPLMEGDLAEGWTETPLYAHPPKEQTT